MAKNLSDKGIDIRKVITSEELPKNFILSILIGGYKAMINYCDKLLDFDSRIDSYDEIIIGSPVWNGRFCSPINSVLKLLNLNDKKISFILYSGSGKISKLEKSINEKFDNVNIFNLIEPKKNLEELEKLQLL